MSQTGRSATADGQSFCGKSVITDRSSLTDPKQPYKRLHCGSFCLPRRPFYPRDREYHEPMLTPFGQDIYFADGPSVSFYGFPYSTRMAVIRLSTGKVRVWSLQRER